MYTAEISRSNPSMILFLLDQSGSMQEVFDPENVQAMKEPVVVDGKTFTHTASGPTKAQALADAINKLSGHPEISSKSPYNCVSCKVGRVVS
jgi:hypothetical protein